MEKRQFDLEKRRDASYFAQILREAIQKNGFYLGELLFDSHSWLGYSYYAPEKSKKKYWAGMVWRDKEGYDFVIEKKNCKKKQYGKFKYGKFDANGGHRAKWFCLKNKYFKKIAGGKKDFKQKYKIIKGFIKEVAKIK